MSAVTGAAVVGAAVTGAAVVGAAVVGAAVVGAAVTGAVIVAAGAGVGPIDATVSQAHRCCCISICIMLFQACIERDPKIVKATTEL